MKDNGRKLSLSGAMALVAGALTLLVLQDSPFAQTTARALLSDVGLPAVDQGLLPLSHRAEVRESHWRARTIDSSSSPGRFVPGRVIVKFKDGVASESARTSTLREVGATSTSRPSYADFEIVTIDPRADPEAVASALAARPDVEYAQASYRVHPYFRPNDELFSRQWNLIDLSMEQAWDINQGAASDIIIAVLDSGLAYQNVSFQFFAPAFRVNGLSYPALGLITVPFAAASDLASAGRIVAPRDFIYDDNAPVDLDGHGTHVAGTIGQLTNNGQGVAGMAFNVRLMPIKVIDGMWDNIFGAPFSGTDDVVARGIRYAVDNGARVINMSIGRDGPPAPVVAAAMQYAVSRGAFIAVAAGNDFESGNPVERIAELAADISGVVAVAATGRDRTRAFYSGVRSYVEIAAPGGNGRRGGQEAMVLQQTYDPDFTDTYLLPPNRYTAPRFDVLGFEYYQGTSMATPHVSGFAALLMTQGITNPAAIEAAIEQFATDLGTAGRDDEYGYGLINPRATLRGLGLAR